MVSQKRGRNISNKKQLTKINNTMTTESGMLQLMPLVDDWMLTTLKIQQLTKRVGYSKEIMRELINLEYEQQSDLTNKWMELNKEKIKDVIQN